jgi:hypothetical protein
MDQLEKIIEASILSPSVDNCQPWAFSIGDDSINIYLDRERADFFGDFGYSSAYVTLGAVLENMIIASNHFGLETAVKEQKVRCFLILVNDARIEENIKG